nr:immunoglobulin light chain junction region [Macaca mulatta]
DYFCCSYADTYTVVF